MTALVIAILFGALAAWSMWCHRDRVTETVPMRKPYDSWDDQISELRWGHSVSPGHDERLKADQIRRRREMSRGAM